MSAKRLAMISAVVAVLLPLTCSSQQTMSMVMGMNDAAATGKLLLDQLELAGGSAGTAPAWDAEAWYGGDYDKAWFKTEGSAVSGNPDASRNELLWDHALTRWWDVQTGVRYDLGAGPARGWAAVGIAGLTPYWFEVEATLYLGEAGRTAARFQVKHDVLITQRLILQPEIETNFYGRSDAARDVSSGLSDLQLGFRVRYEVRREFAPYAGVAWRRSPGGDCLQWVAGFHVWL